MSFVFFEIERLVYLFWNARNVFNTLKGITFITMIAVTKSEISDKIVCFAKYVYMNV